MSVIPMLGSNRISLNNIEKYEKRKRKNGL